MTGSGVTCVWKASPTSSLVAFSRLERLGVPLDLLPENGRGEPLEPGVVGRDEHEAAAGEERLHQPGEGVAHRRAGAIRGADGVEQIGRELGRAERFFQRGEGLRDLVAEHAATDRRPVVRGRERDA